jgi:hypothetical protein
LHALSYGSADTTTQQCILPVWCVLHCPLWHRPLHLRPSALLLTLLLQARHEAEQSVEDLLALVKQIVPYHMTHNAGAIH